MNTDNMLRKYRIYGLTIETDFPFTYQFLEAKAKEPVDIQLSYLSGSEDSDSFQNASLVYRSPYKTADGDYHLYVYQTACCQILYYPGIVCFYFLSEQILYQPLENFSYEQAEAYLISGVLAIWLELHGTVCLHASSIVVNGYGMAFLANSGGGKSTQALNMIQAGYQLLSDDVLPVQQVGSEYLGLPGFPTLRLWPAEAEYFIGSANGLARVHPNLEKRLLPIGTGIFGQFVGQPTPLRCLYLIDRRNSDLGNPTIEITDVPPAQALIELVRQSFAAKAAEGFGLAKQRMSFFAGLVQKVSTRRLIYPSGLEYLPEIRQIILEDFYQSSPKH